MMLSARDTARFNQAHAELRRIDAAQEQEYLANLVELKSHDLQAEAEALVNDRSEVKYVMPIDMLPHFLPALSDEYSVLRVEDTPICTYEITYFDTPQLSHYHAHHNGQRSRCKYRFRRYLQTDSAFLEVKLKNNKSRTIKQRYPWQAAGNDEALDDLRAQLGDQFDSYQPSLLVNYRRMSFWNQLNGDRLTVDFDLHYQRPGAPEGVRLPDVFIAELKRLGKFHGSPFFRRAKSYGYLPGKFSKYCVGLSLTRGGEIKTNNFKTQLSRLGRVLATGATQ